ncbi:Carboxylate-amine ligase bll3764 [hydrothermal vent metagenome]|uniref:Carboxylate-amine ligase bll3764 n=1 Tax=hydrothermal vent metagenome TaxID=652676 RepID=A0A3B0RX78_9ZZZZ
MIPARPRFTVGIEEEYFVVDRATRDLVTDLPRSLLADLEHPPVGATSPEFIRSQIEIGTPVALDVVEAGEYLVQMRRFVSDVVSSHDMAIIAASTHPFAEWGTQLRTNKRRYRILEEALQGVVRRLLICGMHVHVEIGDEDLRIDLMNQVTYFLPHLLALSASSPFWHGSDTGLKSYRPAVFRSLPRTGLPEEFQDWSHYQRYVDVLVEAGVIEDASKLWWDIRPSSRYPTLEMRSADLCTRYEDAIAVAALYQGLLAMLYERRVSNQRWRIYARTLIAENNWRAQRYGVEESLIDFGRGRLVPMVDLAEELIDLVREQAIELGSIDALTRIKTIAEGGTSADRQHAVFARAIEDGAEIHDALVAVVDHLIDETVEGL